MKRLVSVAVVVMGMVAVLAPMSQAAQGGNKAVAKKPRIQALLTEDKPNSFSMTLTAKPSAETSLLRAIVTVQSIRSCLGCENPFAKIVKFEPEPALKGKAGKTATRVEAAFECVPASDEEVEKQADLLGSLCRKPAGTEVEELCR